MLVRVGVIGAGWWATRFHIPAVMSDPRARVEAVCDLDRGRVEDTQEAFGIERGYTSFELMLREVELDAVIVATPNAHHVGPARAALLAGCHVLIEKPLATSASEAFELLELADARNVGIVTGHTYQFTSTASYARRWVRAEIGHLVTVNGEFQSRAGALFAAAESQTHPLDRQSGAHPESYSAENGGGQLFTQMSHLLGLVLWTTGLEVSGVQASLRNRGLRVDVDDAMLLEFAGGGLGTLVSTGVLTESLPLRQIVSYVGTLGTVVHDLVGGSVVLHRPDGSSVQRQVGQHDLAYPSRRPAEALIDVASGQAAADPEDAQSGARTVAVLEAAVKAGNHTAVRPK